MVSDASLPEVEVGENLGRAYQVIGMLAAIEHIVVELGVVEMRQREGHHALSGDLQLGGVAFRKTMMCMNILIPILMVAEQ